MSAMPLDGIRVVDFGQVVAIPFCTQWMAWLGAEVILVESSRHLVSRQFPPFDKDGDLDTSGLFNMLNTNKKSVVIDLTKPSGLQLVNQLIAVSDVLVDNFATGVMEKLGLGYESVSELNPNIVMLSLGAFGRTGPLKGVTGFHSTVNMYSGVADVTGYEGGPPRILGGVFPDAFSGAHSLFAILTALHQRRKSGTGQYIDAAMYESMLTLIPEAVIDYTMNGQQPVRAGNRDRSKVPHGIYRCRGEDAWVAISIDSEEQWQALCEMIGNPGWTGDARFADALARREHESVIDAAITAWTRERTPDAAAELLQQEHIPAGPVQHPQDLVEDPQLIARNFLIETDHPKVGRRPQYGLPWRTDGYAVQYRHAPLFDQDTREVVTGLLGVSDAEFDVLEQQGVFT